MDRVVINRPAEFERGMELFKRMIQESGTLRELKLREYYVPKKEKRKLKDIRALKRRATAAKGTGRSYGPEV